MRDVLEIIALLFIAVVIAWVVVSTWLARLRLRQMQKELDALYEDSQYRRPPQRFEP